MIDCTSHPMSEKFASINNLLRSVKNDPEFESFQEMGITISEKLESVNAKIIRTPKIQLGHG